MISEELKHIIKDISREFSLEPAALASFIEVESGGKGFINGKLIIQFEPAWMKRLAPYTPSGLWSVNKVDVQSNTDTAVRYRFAGWIRGYRGWKFCPLSGNWRKLQHF